ncbi:MAG: type II toxin-antitoxin system VapC family toxin [Candidatus Omnitrophica bacterium]|nr:type II toxin-antitoxin system VapC family toxin [Candidatus Omnitrophota bacterium]
MNIVDSSGWIEYLAGSSNGVLFAKPIQQIDQLVVPSITIVEIFKFILQRRTEQEALEAVAHMSEGLIIDLDSRLAIKAANVGYEFKLSLADSIIYATALHHHALLWTQDEDFKNMPGVRYIPKTPHK